MTYATYTPSRFKRMLEVVGFSVVLGFVASGMNLVMDNVLSKPVPEVVQIKMPMKAVVSPRKREG